MGSGMYDTTIGTLLVGIFFNTFLYGLVTYQFATYFQTKYNDPLPTRCAVLFLFLIDTFHSISVIYMAWTYTVTNYNNPVALTMAQWPYPLTPIATALTALVTQLYLGFRIWRFTCSKFLFSVVIVLAIPTFFLGMSCGIGAWIIWVWSELPRLTPLVIAWLVMQVAVDIFISATLIIAFYRSRTGSRRMDSVLNQLIRGAIQTGIFASIFSIGDLVSFVVLPSTNLYGMFAIPIGRIYTNTLLNTLLCRDGLKAELNATFDVSAAIDALDWANSTHSSQSGEGTTTTTSIPLQISQETDDRSCCDDGQSKILPLGAEINDGEIAHSKPHFAMDHQSLA